MIALYNRIGQQPYYRRGVNYLCGLYKENNKNKMSLWIYFAGTDPIPDNINIIWDSPLLDLTLENQTSLVWQGPIEPTEQGDWLVCLNSSAGLENKLILDLLQYPDRVPSAVERAVKQPPGTGMPGSPIFPVIEMDDAEPDWMPAGPLFIDGDLRSVLGLPDLTGHLRLLVDAREKVWRRMERASPERRARFLQQTTHALIRASDKPNQVIDLLRNPQVVLEEGSKAETES